MLVTFVLVIVFFSNLSFGQERTDYQLLWEVSKKDSPDKSYIFGTMHIKDNRAFQFPDALIPAIKNTAVFALEIDPQLAAEVYLETINKPGFENRYKEILSKEEYKKLKDRFFEINNVDLDSFSMKHPMMIESMLVKEITRPNDRRTFLDAYLYSIANNYDKETTGLELIEDQFPNVEDLTDTELREGVLSILDYTQEEQDSILERMTRIYYKGNLTEIEDFVNFYGGTDSIMISRNKVMARSIDSIMQTKTLFSAVGAAHLPHETGVLNLLKEKGYNVTLVPPTFLNDNSQIELIPKLDKWVEQKEAFLGYSVKTPTKPTSVSLNSENEILASFDLISGFEFSHLGFDTSKRTYPEGYNVIEEVIKNQLEKEGITLVSRTAFKKGAFEVTQLITQSEETDGKANRMQLYFDNKHIYLFNAEGSPKEIESTYVNAFFDSVKTFTPEIPKANWNTHNDVLGAFSIDLPGEIVDISKKTPSPLDENAIYDLNIFKVYDEQNQIFNLVRYNDQPTGYYLEDETIIMDQFESYFSKIGTMIGEPKEEIINGTKKISFEVLVTKEYHSRGIIYLRGNRTYLLLSQSLIPDTKLDPDYRFLESFKFTPYEEAVYNNPLVFDKKYQVSFPSDVQSDTIVAYEYSSDFKTTYLNSGIDKSSGSAYLFQQTTLKPYAKNTTKEQYIDDYAAQLIEWGDTLINASYTTVNGLTAKDLTVYNNKTSVRQRYLIIQHDTDLITLMGYLGDEDIDRAQTFFDSFKVLKKNEKFDITASKSKKIFKNLKSKDSVVFNIAKGAFNYYVFDKEDNKLLLDNLSYTFKDHTENYGVKYHILDELATLDNGNSAERIVSYYENLSDPKLKIHALKTLGAFTQPESQQLFMDVIQNNPPLRDAETEYNVFEKIPNPAQFLIKNETILTTLLENERFRDKLVNNYTYTVLNDSIYENAVPLFKEKIKTYFITDAERYADTVARKKHPYINYSLLDNYVTIIDTESYTDETAQQTLITLAQGQESKNWIQTRALVLAIKLNMKIPNTLLKSGLEELYSRFEVMEVLLNNDQKDKIPQDYFSSKSFSQLGVFNAVGYDNDSYPETISYLGDFTHSGTLYHAYSYGMEKNTDNLYLGFAEAKEADSTNFESYEAHVTWEELEADWKTQVLKYLED